MNNKITWKPLFRYEKDYLINQNGDIYSLFVNRILKNYIDSKGYPTIELSKKSITKRHRVHRLVAIAFIENKSNYPQINHKDGNKINNNYSNLEWCTNSHNIKHAWKTGCFKNSKIFKKNRFKQ